MNKEEIRKKFEENVAYLQRNIPPDDIYLFTEQTFMAALFFLQNTCVHICVPLYSLVYRPLLLAIGTYTYF